MKINDYLNMYNVKCEGWEGNKVRPRVQCRDGYTVSVQAGYGCYSYPERYSTYFYGHVPVELVDFILNKHGGIVGADFNNVNREDWK